MDKFLQKFLSKCPAEFNDNDCVEWTKNNTSDGYGLVEVRENGKRCRIYAHRLSFSYFVSPLIEGMQVCHKCDNPPCFNPKHLFQGTPRDNTLDMCTKGRWNAGPPKGDANPAAKLTSEQVLKIRKEWAKGKAIRALAREYPVNRTNIASIVKRKSWKHI